MTDLIGYVIWGEDEAKQWYNGHMTSKEAAEYLGLSRYMLRKLVSENKIPYSRSYRDVSFHQTILDAWMRGGFIPGRVKLILDEECIEFDHRDALQEHYRRYPELLEKLKEQERQLEIQSINSEYKFDVHPDGVAITLGESENHLVFQVFLGNRAVDQLIQSVQKYRSQL
jgi:excisionase family DNA binding protein